MKAALYKSPASPARQRGAALLTALIIVTLVATLASAMVWQQWRAVQVEAAERSRTQSYWVLSGALDWARLILREAAQRKNRASGDNLGEAWAAPLAEARLSSFLAADKDNNASDDNAGPEAFLSGQITDEQSRYNLHNLVANGAVQPKEMAALQRLCEILGLDSSVASRIAQGLQPALTPAALAASAAGANSASPEAMLLPPSVADLGWLGIDAASIAALRPYVTLLPRNTPVNLNTAPKEVIAAVIPVDLASADRLVQYRQRSPFTDLGQVQAQLGSSDGKGQVQLDPERVDYRTSFFEVRGRLRLDDRVVEERSLVERRGIAVVVLRRERIAGIESASASRP
ncbi:MAG TPA: type II secretion system minor pseudopilin GspK [Methylibium sp.]